MASEDPNRLGPVTREWVAALERRIEELESAVSAILYAVRLLTKRGSSAEANVAAWNALEHVEVVNGGRCDEAPATVSHKGRKVSLQEAAEIAMRTLADAERGRDEAATIHLVRRSPESAAVYWREQWEKMHAEVISLRVESHEWKTKYESQCRGVKSYLEQIESLREQLKQRSDQHWTCNGCGFSWNAEPLPERDEHGYRVSPIKCKACECESLRSQLAAAWMDDGDFSGSDCPFYERKKARKR